MQQWPYRLESWSPQQIQQFCVKDLKWQTYRINMKGLDTSAKLKRLMQWYEDHKNAEGHIPEKHRCQVHNYLNALKRGGLLNMDLSVKRER